MKFYLRVFLFVVATAILLSAGLTALDYLFTGEPITGPEYAIDFVEMLVLSSAIAASVIVIDRMRRLETETTSLRDELKDATESGREWRKQSEQLFQGLSVAVAAQFAVWKLTDAEADIAALIMKGVSHRDIAKLRRTSEVTIRQQAQSIYQKSGLGNRSQLAAYFLEDLFDVAAARNAMGTVQQSRH